MAKFVLITAVVVYLFLMSYGRSRADQIHIVIPNFLQVCRLHLSANDSPNFTLGRG